MLFGHGDDYYRSAGERLINYSSNVWYGAEIEPLKAHLAANIDRITRYPEPDAGSLKCMLAEVHQLAPDRLLVTNGSITAFYLIAQAWQKSRSLIVVPSFAEYEDACRLYQHTLTFFPNQQDLSCMDLSQLDFCWICNPNNPDGRLISRERLLDLIERNPQTTFVIDQVYADFYRGHLLDLKEVETHPNLIIVQSISKLHKIPGMRIGYLVASPEMIRQIAAYLIPWSVNALAIEVGKYILQHPEQFVLPLEQWLNETHRLQEQIRSLGIESYPSAVTFFLNRLPEGRKASQLKDYLLKEKQILIRDASNFRTLDERCFRLSTQRPEENEVLLEAIRNWTK